MREIGLSSTESRLNLRRRSIAIAIGVGVIFLIIAIHLFLLQVIRGPEFRVRASNVAKREVRIPAQRGKIYENSYSLPLVTNSPSFSVDLIPGELPTGELAPLLKRLAPHLDMNERQLSARIPRQMRQLYRPIEIKSDVKFATIATLAERIDSFPGVTWHTTPARDYGMIGSLAHVIGYIGDITSEELQTKFNDGYISGNLVGKSGIEKQYEPFLRGIDGLGHRTVDVRERAVSKIWQTSIAPQPGADVVLTIDWSLQRAAEEALGARIGSVIVLRPATGAILAMVSYPWFDPQSFIGDSALAAFKALSMDPSFPFINRTTRAAYPPASVFKILMTTAIVEEQLYRQRQAINCTGSMTYGDRVFNDWVEEGHGYINLKDAFAHSCDIYFYHAGIKLGVSTIVKYATQFGLGKETGIDLPGEVSGIVPTPSWKLREREEPWVGGDTVNLAIGQGFITVTPLQVANMVAMIVNNGVIYKPHVVSQIRDGVSDEIVYQPSYEPIHISNFSEDTLSFVRNAMRKVVTDGTAASVLTTNRVAVAGKTGTAEVGVEDHFHSWFAAYGPYDSNDPLEKIVVVAMVEASNIWEWWAPKAANLIFHAAFTGQTIVEAVSDLKPWYGEAVFEPLVSSGLVEDHFQERDDQ